MEGLELRVGQLLSGRLHASRLHRKNGYQASLLTAVPGLLAWHGPEQGDGVLSSRSALLEWRPSSHCPLLLGGKDTSAEPA